MTRSIKNKELASEQDVIIKNTHYKCTIETKDDEIVVTLDEKDEKNEYQTMQEELGCYDCFYADTKKLGNGPCCTHMCGPSPSALGNCVHQKRMGAH